MPSPTPKPGSKARQPNRSGQRRVVVTSPGPTPLPRLPADLADPGRSWVQSLRTSPQAAHYQPSDWSLAVAAGYVLNEAQDRSKSPSHRDKHSREFRLLCDALLATESARRSVHLDADDTGAPGSTEEPLVDHRPRVGGRGYAE
ncbi:MAG: hypothetical protein V9E98_15110 [Candidatus Nanopelagicales bacterium]